jgi:Carboxypeptidase regulatory-like domain
MRVVQYLMAVFLLVMLDAKVYGQHLTAPTPQPAHIAGTVTDTNGDLIPGAVITIETGSQTPQSAVANDNGLFQIDNVIPGTAYQVTVSAKGFVDWKSSIVSLSPGQFDILTDVKLSILGDAASVIVVASREELATEQVKLEEKQRVLGFIPNFYVSYDKNAAPLTPKLKFELALKISIDPVTFAGTSFLAATDQASHYPDYVEGMKGYGQRFGSIYVNDLTDIMIGGAILPSILHQDPRYFYQGTGTNKSRLMHALSSPIICKGDNGRWQPNYSSLGGYLASGAIANTYYPEANRGPGLVARTFAVDFSANVANGILQEFVLRKLTRNGKGQH